MPHSRSPRGNILRNTLLACLFCLFTTACESTRYPQVGAPENKFNYRVRAGDRLALEFHMELDLSAPSLVVSSEGEIQLKMYDQRLKVEGMTLDEIKAKVEDIYRKYIKNPTVIVRLETPRPRFVTFFGLVGRPGPIELKHELGGLTFMSALSQAGDIPPRGSKNGIRLLRDENGRTETYIIDYDDLIKGKAQDFQLQEGDRIYVSESIY